MYKLTLLSLLIALPFGLVQAQTPEEKGLAIATEIDARDQGWQDQTSNMQMILTNRQGQSSTRKIRLSSLEVPSDGDKSISIFDEPADVKGTAFLSHTHAVKADDQWLYLPALKRVKRISSSNKSGPFMGSEFAYEDIASQEVAKYAYKYLGEEEIDGRKVFINELYPQYKKSGYTRQVAWVDQERYVLLKVEFYDRKNTLLKTLNFVDYNQYLDKYWRPNEMHMVNHQTGKSSKLIWSDYTFRNGLSDSDFERSILQRLR